MTKTSERGQAGVLVAIIALVLGVIAFAAIYGANARQNHALANSVGQNIARSMDASAPEVEDIYMENINHAARRHGEVVYVVAGYCNSGTNNAQAHMHWASPKGPRDAFVCLYDSKWWVVVEGTKIGDDNIVTVFPRPSAQALQDVIDYLITAGYQ